MVIVLTLKNAKVVEANIWWNILIRIGLVLMS